MNDYSAENRKTLSLTREAVAVVQKWMRQSEIAYSR
jgi:hypothetical protein